MKISIIIVSWNTRDMTLDCLGHLLSLRLPDQFEVWLVDNGSKDGSSEEIRKRFPQVNLLVNSRNLGFARAVNQALAYCRAAYILLLNTDCFPEPDAILRLIEAMERDPQAGLVGGALLHEDGRPQHSFGVSPNLATELLHKGFLQTFLPGTFPSKRFPPREVTEVEALVGAFLMVRREAWRRVGGLDERYFFFLEETDWCLRMRQAGWRVLHVPQAKAVHRQGRSAGYDLAGARLEYYRSRYRFFAAHRGKRALKLLKIGLILRCLANWTASMSMNWVNGRRGEWVERHLVNQTLLHWHLRGCPDEWGLPRD